jgi:parallel beta-helix repeat protein
MMRTSRLRAMAPAAAAFLCWASAASAGKSIAVPSGKIATIPQAMAKAGAGDTVWVADGVYTGGFFVNNGVVLKARSLHKAILDGGKKGTVVTLGRNCTVSGFIIRNGTIGVFSSGFGNTISHAKIVYNYLSGIICVRNLPKIEDNIIAFNGASGVQTWDVNATAGAINHNTIAFNGNHGVAAGGESNVVIENNIISFNKRFGLSLSKASGGGQIVANNVFGNVIGAPAAPPGNFSFDPGFSAPRFNLDFSQNPKHGQAKTGTDNEPLGARLPQ